LSGDAAYELIRELNNAEEMAATLLRNALKSTKCTDNVTVIVVRL
jgi:serine/threonine protein phosphatase PrpC